MITEDGRSITDVKVKIGMVKVEFSKRKELLTKRMRECLEEQNSDRIIWQVALYDCETWTLRKEEINRLNALECWIWRRIE
jgi:hypothetical protein